MKYKIFALLCIFLLLGNVTLTARAAETAELNLQTDPAENGSCRVDVTVSPAHGIAALQFRVGWESLGTVCSEITAPSLCGVAPVVNMDETGVIYLWDALSPITEETLLLSLYFELEPGADCSVFFDSEAELIAADNDLQLYAVNTSEAVHLTGPEEDSAQISEVSSAEIPEDLPSSGESNGLTLSQYAAAASQGEEFALSSGTEEKIAWSSSNEKVAVVSEDGTVTALSPGEAVIMAQTVSGDKSATCVIIVTQTPEEAKTLQERMGDVTSPASPEAADPGTIRETLAPIIPDAAPSAGMPPTWLYAGLAGAGAAAILIAILLLRERKKKIKQEKRTEDEWGKDQ